MRIYKLANLLITPLLGLTLLAGCANLAPDYARPELPVPTSLDQSATPSVPSTAKLDWQEVVTDTRLKQTVELALANNRDLRIAALNIEKARAQYRIQESSLYPAVNGTFGGSSSSANDTITRKFSAGLGITSYELDFFGRLTNLKDAALQSFLATEATQRSVRTSLIERGFSPEQCLAIPNGIATERFPDTLLPARWADRQPTILMVSRFARQKDHASLIHALALLREHGLTPTQLALAFCYNNWRVASTIIGVTSLAQLDEDLAAWGTTLSPELLAAIDQIRWQVGDPAI